VLTLPPDIMAILAPFAPAFSRPIWRLIQMLVAGVILAPGQRMITSILRTLGLEHLPSFGTYHRVLSRAVWSSLTVSRILLGLLITTFVPTGPLVIGIDETIERRRGVKISAKGIYRDPVRSSHSHFVKASGLRWICMMLLVPIPWADRVWAFPFLTVLAPSERSNAEHGRRHKTITDWARQMIRLLHRWYPARQLVVVADREYAAIAFLAAARQAATIITRLRLDARLFAPAPPRRPEQMGRPRLVGSRLPSLATRAIDPATNWTTVTMSRWYVVRDRSIEIVSDTAVWYRTGVSPVPIRWVLIRDPQGTFPTQPSSAPTWMLVPSRSLPGSLSGGNWR